MSDRMELETAYWERPQEGVAVVTLNRPEASNGVTAELARDLLEIFQRIDADRTVRAVVLTGAGRHFCAGADLRRFQQYLQEEIAVTDEPFNARELHPVTQKIVTLRQPVIAAINGAATAGGFDLTLACDLRIASSRARVGETYVNTGLAPGNGGAYFLPRLVGTGKAAELTLTGALLDAQEALEIGLLSRVVEPEALIDTAVGLAAQIAAKPQHAIEAAKLALRVSWQIDLDGNLNNSYWTSLALQRTADVREAIDALLEKRVPNFNRAREQGEGKA